MLGIALTNLDPGIVEIHAETIITRLRMLMPSPTPTHTPTSPATTVGRRGTSHQIAPTRKVKKQVGKQRRATQHIPLLNRRSPPPNSFALRVTSNFQWLGTRAPRLRRPAPAVAVDFSARHFGDTDVFVTLAVRVDKSTFSWERERSLEWGHLEENYTGDLEPLEEPLLVLLHNRPFDNLDTRAARIT